MSEKLTKELVVARRRGLSRLGLHSGRLKQVEVPLLTAIARVYRPRLTEREAITTLVTDAIGRMEEGLTRRTLTRLFGLDREVSRPTTDTWRKEARAWHPYMDPKRFFEGPERHMMRLLADHIHALTGTHRPAPLPAAPLLPGATAGSLRNLGGDLRGLVEALDAQDRFTGQLLRGLAFLPERRIIPAETLHLYATSTGLLTGDPVVVAAACARAADTLRELGFIHRETTIGVELHAQAQPVLRLIYEPDIDTTCRRLRGLLAALADDTRARPHRDTIKALTTEALTTITARTAT